MRLTNHTYLLSGAAIAMVAALSAFSEPVLAAVTAVDAARETLYSVYESRADLQQCFDRNGVATPAMKQKGLASLEEWAVRYGSREYPVALAAYAATPTSLAQPVSTDAASATLPRALKEKPAMLMPVKSTESDFSFSRVTAQAVLVIDDGSRKVLLSRNADQLRSMASISKLMTALVSMHRGVSLNTAGTILRDDEVGGARLRVDPGTPLTIRDIFDAMLVGSANNAANALARSTGLTRPEFVKAMNAKAQEFGLASTTFADPSGIEVENISTASDIAALGLEAFDNQQVRRATTTTSFTLVAANKTHIIKNTDWMLNDPNNGLYVLGGKTGYLNESGWNFVVRVKDSRQRPLLVVVLGSSTQQQSFNDAALLAKWTWANYRWTPAKAKK